MKNYKHFTILGLLFLFESLFAQESTVAAETVAPEVSASAPAPLGPAFNDYSKGTMSRFGFFVGGLPVPMLSGGAAASAEFLLTPWLSLTGGYERRRASTDRTFEINLLDEGSRTIAKSTLLGLRIYNGLSGRWWKGFYINAGYKWSTMDTKYTPGLFAGNQASRVDSDEDVYAGLGYRLTAQIRKNTVLLLDVGVNYEPGGIRKVYYDDNGTGLFGPNPDGVGLIQTDVGHQLFPEAKVGLRF